MIKKITLILLSVCFAMNFYVVQAQYDSKDKKAIAALEKAIGYLSYYQLEAAQTAAQEALKRDPNFSDAYLLLAEVYHEWQWEEKQLECYEKALKINPNRRPIVSLNVGEMLVNRGEYERAKEYLTRFSAAPHQRAEDQAVCQLLLSHCRYAIEAMKHPVEFNPFNLGEAVNSPLAEYFPVLTVDGKTLLFTRRIPITSQTGSPLQEDFYVSVKSNHQWQKAVALGAPINTDCNEGAPTLSADGRLLIFAACAGIDNSYGEGRTGAGSCDLFYSVRTGNRWSEPKNMGAPINTSLWESQPSLSADGRTLYFIRANKRNGSHDQDIYVSHRNDNGTWSRPIKLPDNINTPYREESVFIHPDGQTLYFSSCGHPGMGSSDIYKTTKTSDSTWSEPVNLGYPINTFNEEHSFCVSGDGKEAYFASNREGGFGETDIYHFALPQAAQAIPVTYMTGQTYDATTRQTFSAQLELIDLESGKTVYQTTSATENGKFLVVLPTNKNYALNAHAAGYLFYSEHFELKAQPDAQPYYKDVPLTPIVVGEKMILRNIFFDTDQFVLRPESHAELQRLVEFLQKNPNIRLEIEGHTDDSGTAAHNQTLSEQRAKAVYDYLLSANIAPERLSYRGFGATQPLENNQTEEGRAANRRTECRIVE